MKEIIESLNKARTRTIENAIDYCLKRTKTTGNEHAFTYNVEKQEITSPIIMGVGYGVGDPENYGRTKCDLESNGHFHTHPEATFNKCLFSFQDIYSFFEHCHRDEMMLGCVSENGEFLTNKVKMNELTNNYDLTRNLLKAAKKSGEMSAFISSASKVKYNTKEEALRMIEFYKKQAVDQLKHQNIEIDYYLKKERKKKLS